MNRILDTSCIYLFFMSKKKTPDTAKQTTGRLNTPKNESIINIPYHETEFEKKYSKFFWILIPVLAILFYSYRKIAVGFYQDDEVAQYINMLQFWQDPSAILGNGPKPGYKIFMVIPALISYDTVLIFNSIIAATTVYLTYILLKVYKINYAFFGALLLASQPMFVGLSFRSYSEIFTALCLVSFLILYKKEKFLLSGLVLGYIFSIRQEIALLIIIIGIIFIRRKQYLPAAALLVFPVIYNLLGLIKTGDVLFVLTEMRSVAGLNYKSQGLVHYFKVYIYIVGPVNLALFLLGFFGFLNDTAKWKEYLQTYFLFYILFISIFIIQMLTMINDGPNPGNWRYLLHISPICALFAVVGLNNLSLQRFKTTHYLVSGIFVIMVGLFLSYATDGFVLLEKSNYTAFGFVTVFIVLTFVLGSSGKAGGMQNLAIALVILSAGYIYFVEPKQLSPENISVKETAEFLDSMPDKDSRLKLTNHSFIRFYSSSFKNNPQAFKFINSKTLNEAPKGSYIIWETHYGMREKMAGDDGLMWDVPVTTFQDTTKYKLIKAFTSSDKRFEAYIIEKQ
jgi:hypothetical protein